MADTVVPEVLWAQRSSSTEAEKNFIYLTITAPDVLASDLKIEMKTTGLSFTGTSSTQKKTYHIDLELFGEIDTAESRYNHTGKGVDFKLQKKELKEEYWPRLLKDTKKVHYLKTNFDKWVDEDEQNEAADDDLSKFGGMGGMPGAGGDFGGIDFSKLGGGAGGMPDLSSMGMEGMPDMSQLGGMGGMGEDDDDDDDDDDDMPALEESDAKPAAEKKA